MQITTLFYLEITQQNIDIGIPNDSECCPIANAIAEAFPLGGRILVDGMNLQFYAKEHNPNSFHSLNLDEQGQQFIEDFDNHKAVEPMILLLSL